MPAREELSAVSGAKLRMKSLTVILAMLLIAPITHGQPVSIDGLQSLGDTRHHTVTSATLDKRYHVLVGLPADYDSDDHIEYPTIYILDGGALYPLFRSYLNFLQFEGEAPDVILVAISYGTDDWEQGNDRSHDYTAPAAEREFWGGAADFQAFLAEELIPFVEREYRSRASRRVLFGRSIGGQFVLYTAQTKPGLFWGHIASNPALHLNLPLFLSLQPEKPVLPSHLLVTSGANDDPVFREPTLQWVERWTRETERPWRLRTETLDGHGHFTTPAASFRLGLTWLFADYDSPQESS
jgi:predicted alpha/beta superfamily hydrolase